MSNSLFIWRKKHPLLPSLLPHFRWLQLSKKVFVEKKNSKGSEKGKIRKITSNFTSPIVLVKKKDDSFRLYVDYRKLNLKTHKHRFFLSHQLMIVLISCIRAKYFILFILFNQKKKVDNIRFLPHYQAKLSYLFSFGLPDSTLVFQKYIYNVFFSNT